MYCSYYQAHVPPAGCWFVIATLKSFEHISFDRTLDVQKSIVEFFVPHDTESYFVEVMTYFQKEGLIKDLSKLPNRLQDSEV